MANCFLFALVLCKGKYQKRGFFVAKPSKGVFLYGKRGFGNKLSQSQKGNKKRQIKTKINLKNKGE